MAQIVRYPDSPFILHQPFPPAGDQPSAIEALSEGLEDGVMFQTLLGVTGSGKTYTMANVIARLGVPALIMAPNKTLAAQTYAEMRDFFPENAVEYFVSYYDFYQPEAYVPARDLFIEKDAAVNEHIEQMRLAATKSILERRDTIIVATVSAIYGIGKPESYTVQVPPHGEAQVAFTIRVSTSGTANATISLFDRNGAAFGATQVTHITSALQISDKSGFVIIGFAVLLGAVGLWRQFNRKKDPDE